MTKPTIELFLPGLLGPWPTIYRPQLKAFLSQNPSLAAWLNRLCANKNTQPAETIDTELYARLSGEVPPPYALDRWHGEHTDNIPTAFQTQTPSFCADPISMQAEMHGARVFDSAALQISEDEAQQLGADFNNMFADDGYHWLIIENRGYLFTQQSIDLQTQPLMAAQTNDLLEWGFGGRDYAQYQQYATEWQMWLYQHPINATRRQKKQLTISAIWLWGEGAAIQTTSPYSTIFVDQPSRVLQGLCKRLQTPIKPLAQANPAQSSLCLDTRLQRPAEMLEWELWLSQLTELYAQHTKYSVAQLTVPTIKQYRHQSIWQSLKHTLRHKSRQNDTSNLWISEIEWR